MSRHTVSTHIQDFTDVGQALLPVLDAVEERSNKPGGWHSLQLHCIVIQNLKDLLHWTKDEASIGIPFHVLLHLELQVAPSFLHFFDPLSYDT